MRITEDGAYHVRQSDIDAFTSCPESFRLKQLVEDGSSDEGDAALVGSALHATIAHEVLDGPEPTVKAAKWFAQRWFLGEVSRFNDDDLIVYRRDTFGNETKALRYLEMLVESWYASTERDTLLHYDPSELHVEEYFDRPFLVDDPNGRPDIWLCGTGDLVFANQVWDWKSTASMQKFTRWELQRWAAQPTVYCWNAADQGWINADLNGLYHFSYKVFVRSASKVILPETVSVTRSSNNFLWLAEQVERMVDFQETMGLDRPWPVNDQSWKCSRKWCPFFDQCKGRHVDADTWT